MTIISKLPSTFLIHFPFQIYPYTLLSLVVYSCVGRSVLVSVYCCTYVSLLFFTHRNQQTHISNYITSFLFFHFLVIYLSMKQLFLMNFSDLFVLAKTLSLRSIVKFKRHTRFFSLANQFNLKLQVFWLLSNV